MAQHKDTLPSQMNWIHELAKAEIHPDAEKLLQLGRSFDPHQLVEENTIDYLTELRAHFAEFAKVFNSYSQESARFSEVKIYGIANSSADFMVFRNQVKLVVTNSAHGVIQFAFAKHIRGAVSFNGKGGNSDDVSGSQWVGQPHELVAEVGPFRDVYWTYQRTRVSPVEVARFYFSEFARATRDSERSSSSNQLLLEQIKAFLHEKGLNL
jgi:hypothetical protein